MKINFSDYDLTDFNLKEGVFCGLEAILITPKEFGVKWTAKNRIFRSSIWTKEGELLSAGFAKFFSLSENPELSPPPTSLEGTNLIEKTDGSLLIIDYVNGQFSMRTRGTFTYKDLENWRDFETVIAKYPKIKEEAIRHSAYSHLYEIVTPNQKIVIDYGTEPDCFLINLINKQYYLYCPQSVLDDMGEFVGVKRPKRFDFTQITDLCSFIKLAEGIEGCCLYSQDDQEIHKIKSDWYLLRHRLKSTLGSFNAVFDLFVGLDKPSKLDFINHLAKIADFECVTDAQETIDELYLLHTRLYDQVAEMTPFINELKALPRKDAARVILAKYRELGLDAVAFCLLNGRTLDPILYRKMIYQLKDKN